MSPFARLAHSIARRPKGVVTAWTLVALSLYAFAILGLPGQGSLEDRTSTGPPEAKGSESYVLRHAYLDSVPADSPVTVAGQVLGADATDLRVQAAVAPLLEDVAAIEGVQLVTAPFTAIPGPDLSPALADGGADPRILITTGDEGFLVVVQLSPTEDDGDEVAKHEEVKEALLIALEAANVEYDPTASYAPGEEPMVDTHVFSNALFFDSFDSQLQKDLITGEAIAIPLALIVMVFVFGGFLAASTPIAGAIASIAGGTAVLYGFTFIMHIDSAAENVVTVLGIGLCIDYGLLIVSRYREELTKGRAAKLADVRGHALERTMETAGRTVFFSGVTVGIAVGGLLVFTPEFLKGFGGAALGVVTTAVLVAMTLVPAVAYLYGERLVKPGLLSRAKGLRRALRVTADVERDEGAFSTLAGWVQRRPWLVLVGSVAILAVFASPALSLNLRNSEAETLPASDTDRIYLAAFNDRYPALADPAIDLMTDATVAEFEAWAPALLEVDGVERVAEAFEQGGNTFSGLHISIVDEGSPEAVDLVKAVRVLDAPFDLYVGEQAANQVDFIQAIKNGAPIAGGIVVAATFILLFLMTGSLLVPVKTLIINTLSLSASVGILVWIFQEGHFEGLLRYESLGGIETYVVVLVVSFGFGLAMDYEVFLLARIKELVDRGVPNNEAMRLGLQRSGRIITSAAAIIILVFLGFATGSVLIIKEIGFGLAIAVLLDATIVRMLLVPATMTLLGNWNWWAPKSLKNVYAKMAITH